MQREFEIDVRFAPFLLDPSIPPEGKPRRQQSQPGDPPSPLELRGQSLGITFNRGRERTSYSLAALEAAEFATANGAGIPFHKAMFEAYFTGLRDISDLGLIVQVGETAGLDGPALRHALETGEYRQQVIDGIGWSRSVGVTAIPTFVFDDQYGVVGAQDYSVLQDVMRELGHAPRATP
ncbi:MAG: hypothetical protein C0506_08775 [Anaerolinea sp.]|nr:hypothetical protein [Anaerolinea sp.]